MYNVHTYKDDDYVYRDVYALLVWQIVDAIQTV